MGILAQTSNTLGEVPRMQEETGYGLTVHSGDGMTRLELGCQHQRGLVYVIPGEMSWVCSPDMMPGHALAGFLGELTDLGDQRVQKLMERWGLYFRKLHLEEEAEAQN
jgi:hypothetical protein